MYLQEELRKHDPDRYLISLFAPKDRQAALWALFLFNLEVAKTRFLVTDTTLGLIRLQWWRDELDKLYAGQDAPAHPVLQGLEPAIRDYGLPKALFDNLIYAREFDLEGMQPTGVQGLENYADLTTTPLTKLALQIAGDDPALPEVQTVSIRYALVQLFRAMPIYEAHGFDVVGGKENIQNMLDMFETPIGKIPSKVLKAHDALALIYLKQLRKLALDPYKPQMNIPPAFKELRVWLATR